MKRLKRISLINWHRFTRQTFEVEGNLLLLGDNGSGKSTILDALQVGLVGNLRSVRLNLAANEGGDRSLKSYVLGLVGGGNNGRPGRTLRKNATAYILLEFADDESEDALILGTVIDAHADGRPPEKDHFLATGVDLGSLPILHESEAPRNVRDFKRVIANHRNIKRFARVEDYQQAVLKHLGGLDPEFFRLFVSGMAFRKIRNLRDFVYDFLLPEAADVQVESLRDAVERYRQMHALSDEAEQRIALLDRIAANAEDSESGKREQDAIQIRIERAKLKVAEQRVSAAKSRRDQCEQEQDEATREHEALESEQQSARTRLNALQKQLAAHDEHAAALAIESKITQLADEIRRENRSNERLTEGLRHARAGLTRFQKLLETKPPQGISAAEDNACTYRERFIESCRPETLGRLEFFADFAADCTAGKPPAPEAKSLAEQIAGDWPMILHWLQSCEFQIEAGLSHLEAALKQRKLELNELREGHHPLPAPVANWKHELAIAGIDSIAFCEALRIVQPELQKTVEAVLGPRAHDLLVSPANFAPALKILRKLPKEDSDNLGLVNTPRLAESLIPHLKNSLAEAIDAEHSLAKRYAQAILGGIGIEDGKLRGEGLCVRPKDGLIFEDYAVRRLPMANTGVWADFAAGTSHQEEQYRIKIAEIHEHIRQAKERREEFRAVGELLDRGRRGVEILAEDFELPARLGTLREQYAQVRQKAAQMKESDLGELRESVDQAERDDHQLGVRLKHAWGRQCVAEQSLKNAEVTLARAQEQLAAAHAEYASKWPAESEPSRQCENELAKLGADTDWEERIRDWTIELESMRTSFRGRHDEGVHLRTEYNNRFQFRGDCLSGDVDDYLKERKRWAESELPNYKKRLSEAMDSARRILEEEVIHRLRERLLTVERHFRELNAALDGLNFSGRSYHFVYKVQKTYESFHEMIMASGEVDGEPLHESAWHARFSEGPLDDLLADVMGGKSAKALAELEHAMDYRAYFDYDIEITEADGSVHPFSHVAGSGSGGETQTPYYVAMLASLARVYRTRGGQGKQAALVAFDEPFQKMDESNIAATLQLADRLGLQVLLAAPKDRCHQLLPALGTATCLLVLRDGNQVSLEPFQRFADDENETLSPEFGNEGQLAWPAHPKSVK